MIKSLVITVAFSALVSAQVLQVCVCPQYQAKRNFNATRYLGTWYEQEKYFAIFELGGKCIKATYSLRDDGKIRVQNSMIIAATNKTQDIEGYAEFTDNPTVGKLGVTFPSVPATGGAPYWVLETDYDSFVLVWGCQEFFSFFNFQTAWILTRQRNPDPSVIAKAYDAANKMGFKTSFLSKTDQTNCPA